MEESGQLLPGTFAATAAAQAATLLVRRLRQVPEEDRARPLRVRLDAHTAPYLYEVAPEQARRAWAGIETLEARGLVRLLYDPKRPRTELGLYRNPRLEVLPGALTGLAEIAGITLEASFGQQLAAALAVADERLGRPGAQAALRSCPAELAHFGLEGALARLHSLCALTKTAPGLYLREASAQVFDGLSKVLDGRGDFVAALTGAPCPWLETPVPLIVAHPAGALDSVVFVENLTTFERLRRRRGHFPTIAFIYGAGWRGGAARARLEAGRSLYFDQSLQPVDEEKLRSALDGRESGVTLHFYGDLDYAGLGILKTMRQTFPMLTAWEPGYAPLRERLLQGGGHAPGPADKEGQVHPGPSGCAYADKALLPALEASGRFVDQECWDPR